MMAIVCFCCYSFKVFALFLSNSSLCNFLMSLDSYSAQISSEVIKVPYILIICEAEEFCDLVNSESLMSHISRVQRLYPLHTVCYLTNKLMAYINKRLTILVFVLYSNSFSILSLLVFLGSDLCSKRQTIC